MVRLLLKKILANNNFLSLMGNASAALLGFVSFAILARSLSKEDFGVWVLFVAIATLFELLRTGFIQTPFIKFGSGVDAKEFLEVKGTSWLFGLIITLGMGFLTFSFWLILKEYIDNKGFLFFLKWFWLLNLVSLPYNVATWVLQSEMKFNKILYIRVIVLSVFIGFLASNFFLNKGLNFILFGFLFAHTITSIITLLLGWGHISSIKNASVSLMKKFFNFGKFSMGTMLGANLLRSSDTIIIGAVLGAPAVALYSVPLKLLEMVEIPIRSFIATALPSLSKYANNNDRTGLRKYFEKTSGMLTISMLPLVLVCFIFAEPLVWLLGGDQYLGTANILRVFAVFAAFMPLDRYSGITLDVLNKPNLNFWKVVIMLTVNVSGNFAAIYLIGELWAIAAKSVFTFISGVVFGVYFLKKLQEFSVRSLLSIGFKECRLIPHKIFSKFRTVG